jgi:threonine/homoserine/homoserine lactone efflux protein
MHVETDRGIAFGWAPTISMCVTQQGGNALQLREWPCRPGHTKETCEFLMMEVGVELGALSLAFARAGALGFLVAAPVGPVGALCINRTLGSGAIVGLATGLGAATVHGGWTLVMALGLTTIAGPDKGGPFTQWATVAGALLLTYIGIRACIRPSVLMPAATPLPTALVCLSAYLSGIALTSISPTTPLLFLTTVPALLPGDAQASLYWPLLAVGLWVRVVGG